MHERQMLNLMKYLDVSVLDLTQDVAHVEKQVRAQVEQLCAELGRQMSKTGAQVARDILAFGLSQLDLAIVAFALKAGDPYA